MSKTLWLKGWKKSYKMENYFEENFFGLTLQNECQGNKNWQKTINKKK